RKGVLKKAIPLRRVVTHSVAFDRGVPHDLVNAAQRAPGGLGNAVPDLLEGRDEHEMRNVFDRKASQVRKYARLHRGNPDTRVLRVSPRPAHFGKVLMSDFGEGLFSDFRDFEFQLLRFDRIYSVGDHTALLARHAPGLAWG